MKHRRIKYAEEEGCIDLVERAMHLLRQTPLSTWLFFYVGAVPFVMGVLFFLTDMSASPFAEARCAGGALGLALLYIWMRVWQAVFCSRLYDRAANREVKPLTAKYLLRSACFHLTHSAWGLLVVPVAALVVVPFGWVYAYFQNLCIVDISPPFSEAAQKARKLSKPWPKQNHYVIAILYGFGYLVFFNVITVVSQLPGLLKTLAGIESEFTLSYHWMMSSTFLAAVCGLTYLIIEPFIKSAYVLRFHACESITTGEDILADLKRLTPRRRAAGLISIGLVFVLAAALPVKADPPQTPPEIEVETFDAAVDRVMQDREFTWRMPKEYAPPAEEKEAGFFAEFLNEVEAWFKKAGEWFRETMERFFKWLGDRFTREDNRKPRTRGFDPGFFKGLSIFLLIVLGAVLVIFLVKALLAQRRPPPEMKEAKRSPVEVDIEDENIIATMFEEDQWIELARELTAKGEYRKAMRAWFLAGLALLSRKNLLSVLHSKSNLDYHRELIRRARRSPELPPVFADNILLFERAWYGLHCADTADLKQLEQNLERMRRGLEA